MSGIVLQPSRSVLAGRRVSLNIPFAAAVTENGRKASDPMTLDQAGEGAANTNNNAVPEGGQDFIGIGEMARKYGVTLRALRFYEDKGLISPMRVDSARLYSRRDRVRLKLILLGRKVGFSLRDVKQMLDLYDPVGRNTKQYRLVLEKSEKQLGTVAAPAPCDRWRHQGAFWHDTDRTQYTRQARHRARRRSQVIVSSVTVAAGFVDGEGVGFDFAASPKAIQSSRTNSFFMGLDPCRKRSAR